MDYITVPASIPGHSGPKLEKRTKDSRTFQIDCSNLLMPSEVIAGGVVGEITPAGSVEITDVRSRQGKFVAFRLQGGPDGNPAYSDHTISITFKTSKQNVLEAVAQLRVHAK